MKKLLIFLLCTVLVLVFAACGQPSLKTERASVQTEQTQKTQETTENLPDSEEPTEQSVSWSVEINGFTVKSEDLEAGLESVYMRVGCTPSTGYRMEELIDFAGEGENITGITVTFENDSYLSLSSEDLQKEGTLLVIATDDEPLAKPMLGYEELIYMIPVVKITVNH